jgi:hypothetical protein
MPSKGQLVYLLFGLGPEIKREEINPLIANLNTVQAVLSRCVLFLWALIVFVANPVYAVQLCPV